MAPLFIHIGAHKTGTTALQAAMDASRAQLLRQDVVYPSSNWYFHGHHRLAFAMRDMQDPASQSIPAFEAEIEELNTELRQAGPRRVFLSSEEFFGAPRERIEALQQALCTTDVRIIAVVRRPDSLFLSNYNQILKDPNARMTAPLSKALEMPLRFCPDLQAERAILNWAEVFGIRQTTLLCHEEIDLFAEISRLLGIGGDTLVPAGGENRSVPAIVMELMRAGKIGQMEPATLRRLFSHAMKQFRDHPQPQLTSAQERQILAQFQPQNDRLFAAFGRDNPYRPEIVADRPDPEPLPPPVAIMARIIEQLI